MECPACFSSSRTEETEYVSEKVDEQDRKIVVPGVKVYHCENILCKNVWMPHEEEVKIKAYVSKRSKF